MKESLITLAIIGYVAFSLYKRFKRNIAAASDDSSEEVFEEDSPGEEPQFIYEEEPAQSSPYFSYEDVAPAPAPRPTTKKKAAAAFVAPQPVCEHEAFDLRKAVIYQTVLDNRYIDELNK